MKKNDILISVVMPVYNGEKYLKEAIDSILNQTYTNFEFIIINDGSTDKSEEIIKSYKDKRIILVNNEENLRLPRTLNKGIDLAKGQYIARMDADDVSLPHRFAKQVEFMEKNPEIGVSGTGVKYIGFPEFGLSDSWTKYLAFLPKRITNPYSDSEILKCCLIFYNPLIHPSVMMRKSMLDENEIRYSLLTNEAQDLEMWISCSKHFKMSNIKETLLLYRLHSGQTGKTSAKKQVGIAIGSRKRWFDEIGFDFSEEEYNKFTEPFKSNAVGLDKDFIVEYQIWLAKIIEMNKEIKYFEQQALEKTIEKLYYQACLKLTHLGCWSWNILQNSALKAGENYNLTNFLEFVQFYLQGNLKRFLLSLT